MNKTYLKGIGIAAAAAIAVGICLIGFRISSNRQHEQRVAYAETAVASEQLQLTELAETIDELYAGEEEYVFLKNDIKIEEINKTRMELEEIRVTAEDFKIRETSLPAGLQELSDQKASLTERLSDISSKFEIQKQTNTMFTTEVKNWQKLEKNIIIQDELKTATIEELQTKVADMPEDDWRERIEDYIDSASEQLTTAEDLQKQLDELLKDGTVVTQEDYDQLLAAIEEIRNPKLKEKFTEQANQVAAKIETIESSEEIEEPEVIEEVEEEIWVPQTPPANQPTPPTNNGGGSGSGETTPPSDDSPSDGETDGDTGEDTGEDDNDTGGEDTTPQPSEPEPEPELPPEPGTEE
ncbi:hypothetical protein [Enterococcus olivae]